VTEDGQNEKTVVAQEAMKVEAGMKEDESTVEESVETIDAIDSHESDD